MDPTLTLPCKIRDAAAMDLPNDDNDDDDDDQDDDDDHLQTFSLYYYTVVQCPVLFSTTINTTTNTTTASVRVLSTRQEPPFVVPFQSMNTAVTSESGQ